MKSTDLMIGDYFTVIESNPSEKAIAYAKVVGIDRKISIESYTVSTEYPYFDDSGKEWVGLFSCSIDRLQPIPLTPEILEKNGFALHRFSGKIMEGMWWEIPEFVIRENMLDSVGRNNFKYEYVHQLQHALKLCGIEKEIIL